MGGGTKVSATWDSSNSPTVPLLLHHRIVPAQLPTTASDLAATVSTHDSFHCIKLDSQSCIQMSFSVATIPIDITTIPAGIQEAFLCSSDQCTIWCGSCGMVSWVIWPPQAPAMSIQGFACSVNLYGPQANHWIVVDLLSSFRRFLWLLSGIGQGLSQLLISVAMSMPPPDWDDESESIVALPLMSAGRAYLLPLATARRSLLARLTWCIPGSIARFNKFKARRAKRSSFRARMASSRSITSKMCAIFNTATSAA